MYSGNTKKFTVYVIFVINLCRTFKLDVGITITFRYTTFHPFILNKSLNSYAQDQ